MTGTPAPWPRSTSTPRRPAICPAGPFPAHCSGHRRRDDGPGARHSLPHCHRDPARPGLGVVADPSLTGDAEPRQLRYQGSRPPCEHTHRTPLLNGQHRRSRH
jgi:hypothetical protein